MCQQGPKEITAYIRDEQDRRYSPPHEVRFWKIEEAVGGDLYIILDGIYENQENCKKAFPVGGYCRAVEYAQGHGNEGPVRV